jgi:hypothetical protein
MFLKAIYTVKNIYSISCGISAATAPEQSAGPGTRLLLKKRPVRPNKDRHKHFDVPILGQSVWISCPDIGSVGMDPIWLVPESALCPGAGAARNTVYL